MKYCNWNNTFIIAIIENENTLQHLGVLFGRVEENGWRRELILCGRGRGEE